MTNSTDPDQLASSEANWSGSSLFAKKGMLYSAREGLTQTLFHLLGGNFVKIILPNSDKGLRANSLWL